MFYLWTTKAFLKKFKTSIIGRQKRKKLFLSILALIIMIHVKTWFHCKDETFSLRMSKQNWNIVFIILLVNWKYLTLLKYFSLFIFVVMVTWNHGNNSFWVWYSYLLHVYNISQFRIKIYQGCSLKRVYPTLVPHSYTLLKDMTNNRR